MKLGSQQHKIDLLFTLALFCVFVVCALVVVVTGANVYQKTVDSMTANFTVRTSLNYVSEKIRQNDVAGGVYLDELEGIPALVLEQPIGDELYQTWLYHLEDGTLRELFIRRGTQIEPETGQAILELSQFDMEEKNGLFTFTAKDSQGNAASVKVYPRCQTNQS